jgi:hypothetical protein
MALPKPGSDSLYYILGPKTVYDTSFYFYYPSKNFLYSMIDVSANNGQGKVVAKDIIFGEALVSAEFPNACKHANGRDWWYLAGEVTSSTYYRSLLTPDGFVNFDTQQIGYQPAYPEFSDSEGQNIFTPDGTMFVDFDPWNGVRIYDFDRCTGLLSNQVIITFPEKLVYGGGHFAQFEVLVCGQ